jgi:branched-chain amino acid transport system permease protein
VSAHEIGQQVVNGLSLGSTYALLALGLAMVFSVVGLINFAHGELLTIGGYAMWFLLGHGVPWPLAVPIVIAVTAVSAVLMERIAFRHFLSSGLVTLLLTSFAVSFFLQTAFSVAFGPQAVAVAVPHWTAAVVHIGSFSIPRIQIVVVAVTVLSLISLAALLRYTTIGTAMRAAAEDFDMVRLSGINASRVVLTAFALSGLLAGMAALLYVAQSGSIAPDTGQVPLIKAFTAVIIGGVGSLSGAVAGGLLLGLLEVLLQATLPQHVVPFSDAFALLAVIVVLLVRPEGIFGRSDLRV